VLDHLALGNALEVEPRPAPVRVDDRAGRIPIRLWNALGFEPGRPALKAGWGVLQLVVKGRCPEARQAGGVGTVEDDLNPGGYRANIASSGLRDFPHGSSSRVRDARRASACGSRLACGHP